jgi:ABC-2 type transport system permease protein
MNLKRLLSITKKEFIQIRRDKPSLIMALVIPVVMLLLFGYAVNTDVEDSATAVLDLSSNQHSRELVAAFDNSNYFDIKYYVTDIDELKSAVDSGKAKAGLIIPADYEKLLKRGSQPTVQLVIDGSDPTVARTLLSTGNLTVQNLSFKTISENNNMITLQNKGIKLSGRVWYNPNMESEKFNIPGLIGLIMQNITIMLTAFAMVRERERGTMEQLIVTPIKPLELIIGKLIPYVIIGSFDFILILILGVYWFGVPVNGDIVLLFELAAIFLICALAIGMLISTVSKTQLQAMQMTMLFILPSVLLSGFVFPRETMPLLIKFFGSLVPLTYFLTILRGIVLKGVGLEHLGYEIFILSIFTLAVVVLASFKFRKKLD